MLVQQALKRDYKLCFHEGDQKAAAAAKKARQHQTRSFFR